MTTLSKLIKKQINYTATEVAQIFDVHLVTIKRYIKKLNLDVKKVGNEWQFTKQHIETIKHYRLELFKKYYSDVWEMNYK